MIAIAIVELLALALATLIIIEQRATIDNLRNLIKPLDRDGDGRPGGSLKR